MSPLSTDRMRKRERDGTDREWEARRKSRWQGTAALIGSSSPVGSVDCAPS